MERHIISSFRLFFSTLFKGIGIVLFVPYRLVSWSGILYFMIPPSTKIGVVTFDVANGPNTCIVIGKRIVGAYNYDKDKWDIQAPYRLFFDDRKYTIPA